MLSQGEKQEAMSVGSLRRASVPLGDGGVAVDGAGQAGGRAQLSVPSDRRMLLCRQLHGSQALALPQGAWRALPAVTSISCR